MSILRLGRFVPTTLRDWDAVFRSLNEVINRDADGTVTIGADNLPPQDAAYLTLAVNDSLTNERVLAPIAGELAAVDNGAGASYDLGLADVGTPGEYPVVTTDAKGRVTEGRALIESDIPAEIARDSEVAQAVENHRQETDPHPDLIDDLTAAASVALTDQVLVSQSGTNVRATVAQLKAIIFGDDWDDLRFPAQGINPAGAAAPPAVVTDLTGYSGGLSFSGSLENVISGVAQMPHAWKLGSAIYPHIHWTKPTGSANAVTWEFHYRIIGYIGDTVGAWSGAVSPSGTIGDPTVSDEHLLTYFPAVTMTGLKESSIVYWRIHRRGDTDAEANVVILHEFDFHYQTDKAGTESEIP